MGSVPRPERWPSGRRRAPAKGVWVKSPSRVRIPPSPPHGTSILDVIFQITVAATKWGFEPEIWKRGFDKIADGDFGRRARVARRARAEGPSQSLPLRQSASKFSSVSFRLLRQRRSGDNARRATPKGRGAGRRVIPPSPPMKNPCKSRILQKNGIGGKKPAVFYCQRTGSYAL